MKHRGLPDAQGGHSQRRGVCPRRQRACRVVQRGADLLLLAGRARPPRPRIPGVLGKPTVRFCHCPATPNPNPRPACCVPSHSLQCYVKLVKLIPLRGGFIAAACGMCRGQAGHKSRTRQAVINLNRTEVLTARSTGGFAVTSPESLHYHAAGLPPLPLFFARSVNNRRRHAEAASREADHRQLSHRLHALAVAGNNLRCDFCKHQCRRQLRAGRGKRWS